MPYSVRHFSLSTDINLHLMIEVEYNGIKWDRVVTKTIMLIGEYTHTLDDKNRLSFPVKFRKEMGKSVVITPGLDHCLFVFTTKEWTKIANHLAESSMLNADWRKFNRYLLGGATEVAVDVNGRILIPDFLKERVGLSGKIAIIGVHSRVELWQEDIWKSYRTKSESDADQLAERLSGIGVI